MRQTLLVCLSGLAILAACSQPDAKISVKCGDTSVIMPGALANEIKRDTGELLFSREVCKAVEDVDATMYTQPTAATVVMPNGKSYQVELQAT